MLRSLFSPLLNLMKLKTNECRKKEAGGSNLAQNMICQELLVIRYCSWLCQESWSKIHRDSIIDLRWWSIHTFASSVICWAGHSMQSKNPSIQGFVTTFQQLFFQHTNNGDYKRYWIEFWISYMPHTEPKVRFLSKNGVRIKITNLLNFRAKNKALPC